MSLVDSYPRTTFFPFTIIITQFSNHIWLLASLCINQQRKLIWQMPSTRHKKGKSRGKGKIPYSKGTGKVAETTQVGKTSAQHPNIHPPPEASSRNDAQRSYHNNGASVNASTPATEVNADLSFRVPPPIRTTSPGPIITTFSRSFAEEETPGLVSLIHDDNQPHPTHSRTEDERDHDSSAAAISVAQTETDAIYAGPSNKIYERQLQLKQRGFPLWIPEPDRCLSLPYRRNGVSIGDIGTITPDGAFSFMFNIFLPAGHPINPPELPEGFKPLKLLHRGMLDIDVYPQVKPGGFLASATMEEVHSSDPSFRGMSFETSTEGAILTFPDGALALDSQNVPSMRTYAQAHLASWYRFANGPRGHELENGELHLVTGCDKATSWGMAAIANVGSERYSLRYYRSHGVHGSDTGDAHASIPLYEWEYTGHTEARVGPDLEEIEEICLTDNDPAEEAGIDVVGRQGKFYNQCLFLRTLNLALNEDEFETIEREIAIEREAQDTWPENPWMPKPRSHPADNLNKHLLKLHPHCNAVITHDNDWCAVVSKSDESMPNPEEITRRVLAIHDVVERDGLVYLELK